MTDIVRASNPDRKWCAEATLAAFGIEHTADATGSTPGWLVQRKLTDAGYHLEDAHDYDFALEAANPLRTLAQWLRRNADGADYVLFTAGHVMALRGNVLTDTDGPGSGLRRRVGSAYRVRRPS